VDLYSALSWTHL